MPTAALSVDLVNTTGNQEQVVALPRRQATDFRAFPPGGIADVGGAKPARRDLSSFWSAVGMAHRRFLFVHWSRSAQRRIARAAR